MKLWFLPIHIISDKKVKANKADWNLWNRIMAKQLEDNRVLALANKEYREKLRRKKILG